MILSGIVSTSQPQGECTGYLKDKSVILNRTKPLGDRQEKDGELEIIEEKKEKLRLTINHLQSVFLMLTVSMAASVVIFFIEMVVTVLQIKLLR